MHDSNVVTIKLQHICQTDLSAAQFGCRHRKKLHQKSYLFIIKIVLKVHKLYIHTYMQGGPKNPYIFEIPYFCSHYRRI